MKSIGLRGIDNSLIGCTREAHRQDDFFASFFAADPAYEAQGRNLTLSTDGVEIELRRLNRD